MSVSVVKETALPPGGVVFESVNSRTLIKIWSELGLTFPAASVALTVIC